MKKLHYFILFIFCTVTCLAQQQNIPVPSELHETFQGEE